MSKEWNVSPRNPTKRGGVKGGGPFPPPAEPRRPPCLNSHAGSADLLHYSHITLIHQITKAIVLYQLLEKILQWHYSVSMPISLFYYYINALDY